MCRLGVLSCLKRLKTSKMTRYVIGVDPGSMGGVAILDTQGGEMTTVRMPETFPDIFNLFRNIVSDCGSGNVVAYLENVGHGMPGQSSSATAKFARHNGHLEMALYAAGIRTEMVTPQKWQRSYSNSVGTSKGMEKAAWKNKLKGEAQRLYPSVKVTLWNADAILIANYGRKLL